MERIVVQDCGCISLPEALATALGMTPGAVLAAEAAPKENTLTLTLLDPAPERPMSGLATCPVR